MGKCVLVALLLLVAPYLYVKLMPHFDRLETHHRFSIYRDTHGIPKIVAKDRPSMFFGMGYAHAQDRLWILLTKKFMAAGRMSEVFGAEALGLDLEIRNFNFYNAGKMNLELMDEETRSYLQAYADGVNAYAHGAQVLPLEFYLLWLTWEDWQVEDTLAQMAFFSFCLEFDWLYEIARQRIYETMGFSLALKLIPFGEQNLFRETTIMSNEELKEQGRYKHYDSSQIESILKEHWVSKTMPIGSVALKPSQFDRVGSNAWGIMGNHTASGKPIIANDPHLVNMIPSLFYALEVMVVDEEDQVQHRTFGVIVDGLPSFSVGVSDQFAWGSTASYVDNKDIYHEQVREHKGALEYLFKGEWRPFTRRKETFRVRGGNDVVKEFLHTHRGPVIEHIFNELHYKYGYPLPQHYRVNHTISISAAIYTPDNSSARGLFRLPFDRTWEEFTNSSNSINTPNIDSVYIDQQGNMGYGSVGRIPKRKVPEMGSFLKDGSTDLYDMGEFYSWEEKPKLINPRKGYVCMANNKFAEDSFEFRASIHEQTTGRSYRIEKMITDRIKEGRKMDFEDMKAMQLDTKDQFLSEAFPSVLRGLRTVPELWSSPATQELFKKLEKWDYRLEKDSVEASIYHVWEHEFQETLLLQTSLAQVERESIINHAFFQIYMMKLFVKIGSSELADEERVICANGQLNQTQTHPCLANAAFVFKKLPQLLEKLFNTPKVEEWKWGIIHQHSYKSIPFTDLPVLKNIWGRRTPAGGNSRTVNVGITTYQTKSYDSLGGPVFRFISDLNRTIFTLDTGISGNLFSPHYDNFVGKDEYVEYKRHNPLKEDVEGWTLTVKRIQ